jgi:hypothetical protein
MASGGKRFGAGRKGRVKATPVRKTAEILADRRRKGKMPSLSVMLASQDYYWNKSRKLLAKGLIEEGEAALEKSVQIANMAAPYQHAKLHTQAIISETTVTYVARLPSPIQDLEEWEKQTKLLLKPH